MLWKRNKIIKLLDVTKFFQTSFHLCPEFINSYKRSVLINCHFFSSCHHAKIDPNLNVNQKKGHKRKECFHLFYVVLLSKFKNFTFYGNILYKVDVFVIEQHHATRACQVSIGTIVWPSNVLLKWRNEPLRNCLLRSLKVS